MVDRSRQGSRFRSIGRSVATVGLALLTVSCLSAVRHTPEKTEFAERASFPMTLENGELVVDVTLDEQGPFRMKLDTGASVLGVSTSVRDQLGLQTRSLPWRLSGAGESRWKMIESSNVGRLTLGDHEFRGLECLIFEGIDVDGFVGNGLFDAGLLVLDFPQRQFSFESGTLRDGDDVLPFELVGGVPIFAARMAGAPVELTLDTGFNGWLRLPSEWESRLPHRSSSFPIDVQTIHRVRSERVRQVRGEFSLGPHRLVDPIVVFGSGSPLLGTRAMQYFEVTVDCGSRRVRFARDSREPIAIPPVEEFLGRPRSTATHSQP